MYDFSVVIPTCNRDALLKQAIESVLKQNGVELQIIVVDDGPIDRDNKPALLEFLKEHKILYVPTGGHKGGGFARNVGIVHAQSDLTAFLDDDDQWLPGKLIEQKKLMADKDIGICYTAVRSCNDDGFQKRIIFHAPGCDDHFRAIMRKNFIGTTSSVVVRTALLRQVGGFDTHLPALQDYDLYIQILKQSRVAWTKSALTLYSDCHRQDKISSSRERYIRAADYLRNKYKEEKYCKDLFQSIWKIRFLKLFRSKLFFRETITALLHRFSFDR